MTWDFWTVICSYCDLFCLLVENGCNSLTSKFECQLQQLSGQQQVRWASQPAQQFRLPGRSPVCVKLGQEIFHPTTTVSSTFLQAHNFWNYIDSYFLCKSIFCTRIATTVSKAYKMWWAPYNTDTCPAIAGKQQLKQFDLKKVTGAGASTCVILVWNMIWIVGSGIQV